MSYFNLNEMFLSKAEAYIKKYVEAMGTTHQKNRDQYRWWDYEELISSPDEDWSSWVSTDSSLGDVLSDAKSYRGKALQKINETYGLSISDATKLVKTYIGYHPSYGGYICQIGPYISKGFWHGEGHIVEQAVDKFAYFVIRKRKSTPQEISKSLLKNIESYKTNFNVQFEPSDFSLIVMAPTGEFDPSRERQTNKTVRERVESLDPSDPRTKEFFNRAPITGEGTHLSLNARGYDKLLRQIMGPWYEQTLREKAISENKNPNEIINDLMRNTSLLKEIYNKTYEKWQRAVASGEAAAMGMVQPPKFLDKSLRPLSGAQGFTGVPSSELMANQMGLQIEIMRILQSGVTDPTAISEQLNSNPQRQIVNQKRQKKGQVPVIISPEEVQRSIDKIDQRRQDNNQSIEQVLTDTISRTESMREGRGYDDLKTAFEMAGVYFSSQLIDRPTQTMLGETNAVIFNPPESFENFTINDLRRWREEKARREQPSTTKTEETKEQASPEQVSKDIGEMTEQTKEVQPPPAPEQPHKDYTEEELEKLLAHTVKGLIKIAEDLDNEGKYDSAEEVHKIIRKYAGRLK